VIILDASQVERSQGFRGASAVDGVAAVGARKEQTSGKFIHLPDLFAIYALKKVYYKLII